MRTTAGDRDNSTEPVVILPYELQQVRPENLANRLHRSGQWTTKGMPRPHRLSEQFLRKLARLILIHEDLLPNYVPLSFDFMLGENRVDIHVREHVCQSW